MRKVAGIGLAVLVCVGFAKLGLAQSTDPISGEWLITQRHVRAVLPSARMNDIGLIARGDKLGEGKSATSSD